MSRYYPEGTDLRYVDVTHEQEKQLFKDARAGDEESREFLIKNHLLFALNQGRSWSKGKLPEDDVASAANLALMRAFEKFDPERGVRFSSYLRQWIRSAVADLWKEQDTVKTPKRGEPKEPATVDAKPEEPSEDHPVEADDHQKFLRDCLEECRAELPEDEADVLSLYYGENPMIFEEIGALRGRTRQRIEQIHASGLRKLRVRMAEKLRAAGVTYR